MGILEIHFHDSEFSWTVNPRGSDEKTFSFDSGESSSGSSSTSSGSPSTGSASDGSFAGKLWMLAALAAFVGVGIGFSKLRSRRGAETAESEQESSGRRLSLSRSK